MSYSWSISMLSFTISIFQSSLFPPFWFPTVPNSSPSLLAGFMGLWCLVISLQTHLSALSLSSSSCAPLPPLPNRVPELGDGAYRLFIFSHMEKMYGEKKSMTQRLKQLCRSVENRVKDTTIKVRILKELSLKSVIKSWKTSLRLLWATWFVWLS